MNFVGRAEIEATLRSIAGRIHPDPKWVPFNGSNWPRVRAMDHALQTAEQPTPRVET